MPHPAIGFTGNNHAAKGHRAHHQQHQNGGPERDSYVAPDSRLRRHLTPSWKGSFYSGRDPEDCKRAACGVEPVLLKGIQLYTRPLQRQHTSAREFPGDYGLAEQSPHGATSCFEESCGSVKHLGSEVTRIRATSSGSSGFEKKYPWAYSQPSERSSSACSWLSTPSATMPIPKLFPRLKIVLTISWLSVFSSMAETKERSIFSMSREKRRR